MKRYIILPFLAAALTAQAQDTYMNERITNNSSDVIGTARYVGMGGALGALGADISVISWNPAGIGLYRKNDIAFTFGGLWGKSSIAEENRGKGTVDQAGFVYNIPTGSESCPYVNFSFNYQKKINFNHNFYANNNLGGLSQMDQLAELTEWDDNWQNNHVGLAMQYDYDAEQRGEDRIFFKRDGNGDLYNDFSSSSYIYKHHSEGSVQSFDFNLSTNINDRAFLGLTIGVDNMRYRGWSYYMENFMDGSGPNYDLSNDYKITGTGVNVKLGTIIRPIENSPFRFGLVVETPTWYRLRNSTLFDYSNNVDNGWESYLKFKLSSPWKVRASIGSTVGTSFAWDIDYEYAAYAGIRMGYPNDDNYYPYDINTSSYKDVAMNNHTRHTLRGVHTLRAGMEWNATKNLAFRLGYNLSTSAYEKNVSFDQYQIDYENIKEHNLQKTAIDYSTTTSYMRMGATNILTLGVGYRAKSFYIDLAYKLRNQFADFYAFDTNFTNSETGDPVFLRHDALNGTNLADRTIDPVDVNLTRHAITCTLGFKF
ncbi:MAG: hypothetical protein IJ615_02060 [Bacteroidaceae bacterium]|nr:hypothetical protein [Bacteroidaceae bacterium]